jgi:hypothetical protein
MLNLLLWASSPSSSLTLTLIGNSNSSTCFGKSHLTVCQRCKSLQLCASLISYHQLPTPKLTTTSMNSKLYQHHSHIIHACLLTQHVLGCADAESLLMQAACENEHSAIAQDNCRLQDPHHPSLAPSNAAAPLHFLCVGPSKDVTMCNCQFIVHLGLC